MAIWIGVPYQQVLRDVIIRDLGNGPRNLEEISANNPINGKNPDINELKVQTDYLVRKRIIAFGVDKYVLIP